MNMFIRLSFACLLSVTQTVCAEMDDQALKEYLSRNFTADESIPWEKRSEFKVSRGITDEQLHRVLMEIYSESSRERTSLEPKTRQWYDNRRTVEGVLGWLPVCGKIGVKDFLMDYAVSKENDSLNRRNAVLSYLRIADPEEAKNALLRFLVEGDRMDYMERLSIYEYARMIFQSAAEQKRAAILNALYVAASGADLPPWEFRVCDEILEKISSSYAKSTERFELLKKHNAAFYPKMRERTKNEVKERLEKMYKLKTFTNINTNLVVLKSRDFNLPLPVGATNELTAPVPVPPEVEFTKVGDESNDPVSMKVVVIVLLLAVLGFSAWKLRKSKAH
jgi:hypothetical protein